MDFKESITFGKVRWYLIRLALAYSKRDDIPSFREVRPRSYPYLLAPSDAMRQNIHAT